MEFVMTPFIVSTEPKEFISIPYDRLEEIHVNQIPLDQLSDNDKKLLFDDIYGALADSEKELRNDCNCIDCGGENSYHDSTCSYMLELTKE